MITLSKAQVLKLHESLIREFGGSSGIRDESLLDSALNAPFQEFSDKELFPTLPSKAARLCYGLVKNHVMIDGNKRL